MDFSSISEKTSATLGGLLVIRFGMKQASRATSGAAVAAPDDQVHVPAGPQCPLSVTGLLRDRLSVGLPSDSRF